MVRRRAAGQAIGEVLAGRVNPSGRLPVTFYASTGQLPPFADYAMKGRTYRYFTGRPAYSFGHGLSYTSFAYDVPSVAAPSVRAGKAQTLTVQVRNTGARAGDEVVQLYLSPLDRPGLPARSLKGFARVTLAPGEQKTVRFTLAPRDLAFADEAGTMRVTAGRYRLWLGGGQEGTSAPGAAAEFRIDGNLAMPR